LANKRLTILNFGENKMKKRILLALSVVLVLGLVMAVYALNRTNSSNAGVENSCPMKGMNAQAADHEGKTSCCDKDDCCCKGDSCPMKAQGENASANCCACCGDSCPMKGMNAQATGVDMKNVTVANGENCCNGGACCKGKHG
jgi:hypothetical protein